MRGHQRASWLQLGPWTRARPCCAVGEATRGHNAVATLVHAAAQSCDCTAEMEVPGLLGTDLRLAGVLTSALGICLHCPGHIHLLLRTPSPDTSPNFLAKVRTSPSFSVRTSHTPRSCGVPTGDRDTLTVLRSLSKSIARKRNFVSVEVVYQKLHASITLEIWKRSARQIRASWPLAAVPDSLDPESQSLSAALSPLMLGSCFLVLFSLWCAPVSVLSRFAWWDLSLWHVSR